MWCSNTIKTPGFVPTSKKRQQGIADNFSSVSGLKEHLLGILSKKQAPALWHRTSLTLLFFCLLSQESWNYRSFPPTKQHKPSPKDVTIDKEGAPSPKEHLHLFPQCSLLCFLFSGPGFLPVIHREGSHPFKRVRREMLRTHYRVLLHDANRQISLFHLPGSSPYLFTCCPMTAWFLLSCKSLHRCLAQSRKSRLGRKQK